MNTRIVEAHNKHQAKIIQEYTPQVIEFLSNAVQFFVDNPRIKEKIMKLPSKSKDFLEVLKIISKEEEWEIYYRVLLFSRSRIKVSCEDRYNPVYYI